MHKLRHGLTRRPHTWAATALAICFWQSLSFQRYVHANNYYLHTVLVNISISLQKFGAQLDTNDDDINLVESQPNDKDNNKKVTQTIWRTFGNIIDRILFATLSLIYIIMMLSLLPENFLDAKNPKSVEVVGY